MTDRPSIAVHAFASRVLMSVSVDKTQLPIFKNNFNIIFLFHK